MGELDLDAIASRPGDGAIFLANWERDALVASVRAAQRQVESERAHEHGPSHDYSDFAVCHFCEEPWPCPTAALREALAPFGGDR